MPLLAPAPGLGERPGAAVPADLLDGAYRIHHSRPTNVHVEAARQSHAHLGDVDTLFYDMNSYAEENTRFPARRGDGVRGRAKDLSRMTMTNPNDES